MSDIPERGLSEKEANAYWHKLMQIIVKRYEKETGKKWVSGSLEVREWLEKLLPALRG